MTDSKHIAKDFSIAAIQYAKYATLQYKIGTELIAQTAPHISSNTKLLDVGSGPGDLTKTWPVKTAIALDIAHGMCVQAKKKNYAICASATALPIANASIDIVASNMMLQWLTSPEYFFSEAIRVLKPGGILAVSSFVYGTLIELTQAMQQCRAQHRMSEFMEADHLNIHASEAGFEMIHATTSNYQETYESVHELFTYLKFIGATNKHVQRPRGMMTPRFLKKIEVAYPKKSNEIIATWTAHRMIMRKP